MSSENLQIKKPTRQELSVSQSVVIPKIVATLFLLTLGTYLSDPFPDARLYFHNTVGKWISSHVALPYEDHWTLAGSGRDWCSPAWLFDLAVYSFGKTFGEDNFAILIEILSCSLVIFLAHSFFKISRDLFFACLLASVTACGVLIGNTFGNNILGYILFSAILSHAIELCKEGVGEFTKKQLLYFSLLTALYTNISTSCFFAVLSVLSLFAAKFGIKSQRFRDLIVVLIPAFFFSPYLGFQYITAMKEMFGWNIFIKHYGFIHLSPFNFSIAFFLILCATAISFYSLLKKVSVEKASKHEVAFISSAIIISLANRTTIPYGLIILSIFIAKFWQDLRDSSAPGLVEAINILRSKLGGLSAVGVVFLLASALLVNSIRAYRYYNPFAYLPVRAVDFLIAQGIFNRVLHRADIGWYVIYRANEKKELADEKRAAIDLRALSTNPQIANSEMALEKFNHNPEPYFDFIKPNVILCPVISSLCKHMQTEKDWELIYEDDLNTKNPPKKLKSKSSLNHNGWAVYRQRAKNN